MQIKHLNMVCVLLMSLLLIACGGGGGGGGGGKGGESVDADGDGYTVQGGDCDDNNANINPEAIERIEILRGPSSASYGPNAMAGAISIITRQQSSLV